MIYLNELIRPRADFFDAVCQAVLSKTAWTLYKSSKERKCPVRAKYTSRYCRKRICPVWEK